MTFFIAFGSLLLFFFSKQATPFLTPSLKKPTSGLQLPKTDHDNQSVVLGKINVKKKIAGKRYPTNCHDTAGWLYIKKPLTSQGSWQAPSWSCGKFKMASSVCDMLYHNHFVTLTPKHILSFIHCWKGEVLCFLMISVLFL